MSKRSRPRSSKPSVKGGGGTGRSSRATVLAGGEAGQFASAVVPAGNSNGSRFGWFAMLSQATIVSAITASIGTGRGLTQKPRRSPPRRAVRGLRAPLRRRNADPTTRRIEKTDLVRRAQNPLLRIRGGKAAASGWRRESRENPRRGRRAA